MIKHHIKLFFRTLKTNGTSSCINIFGLSLGLATVVLIAFWTKFEFNMNAFDERDSAQHVQIFLNRLTATGIETVDRTPGPLTRAMADEFPEVAYGVPVVAPRFFYFGVLTNGRNSVKARSHFVGEGFFNIFGCDFLRGSKVSALNDKNAIAISKQMAITLYGTLDVVGKTVEFKNEYFDGTYTISGVFEIPNNSSSDYDIIFSYERFLMGRPNLLKWNNGGIQAHMVLHEGTDLAAFNSKIKDYLATQIEGSEATLFAQKYAENYLYGTYENGVPTGGKITCVKLFAMIAAFIMLIACINFMNLSTARASKRLKEIGIKKVVGANRRTLIAQYLGESILMAFFALFIALGIVLAIHPFFEGIIGEQLPFELGSKEIIFLVSCSIFTGLLAGSYPAIYLSGFKAIDVLKSKLSSNLGEFWVRKGLVVFQFVVSIVMICAVLVIYKQVQFMQTKDLGYDKENILSFPMEGELAKDSDAFLSELKKIPGVSAASHMWGEIPGNTSRASGFQWKGQILEEQKISFNYIEGGYDMVSLLGVKIHSGRVFSKSHPTDGEAIIFNETAIKTMNIEGNPIGQTVNFKGRRKIIGVVKDFNVDALSEKIRPLFFILSKGNNFIVKLTPGLEKGSLAKIGDLYHTFNENYPLDFSFLEDRYQALYASERRVGALSKYFTALAIAISCMGVFGLAAFMAERRKKEIGIRKVLGQSVGQVTLMLSSEFAKLVFISILIALPVAYVLTSSWLSGFAYRISLHMGYFVGAGLIGFSLAMLTVGSQTIAAAHKNPIEGLKEE